MGMIIILAFGALGFVVWAIARRSTYEAPTRHSFQPSDPTAPTMGDTIRR